MLVFRAGFLRWIDEGAEALRWVDGCTRGVHRIDERVIRSRDTDLLRSGIVAHRRTISSSAELAAALGAWTTMIDDGLDWRGWRSLEHHYRRQALRIGSCCAAVTTHGSSSPTPWRISDLATGSKRSELPSWTVHLMPTVNADLRNYPAGLGAVLTSGSAAPPA